jgi:uncharacterized radical SAM superfamily Fe-S cluster-containing enzyme
VLPETLEQRVTFPDVVRALCEQTAGLFEPRDFLPLPCAHPNCHTLAYVYRGGGAAIPLTRLIDAHGHPELLANGIAFTKPRVRALVEQYLGALACGGGDCGCGPAKLDLSSLDGTPSPRPSFDLLAAGARNGGQTLAILDQQLPAGRDFFAKALAERLTTRDVFRVTITSFLDAYNFDLRRLVKCCVHHILPSGHVVPFCAYNVLYREGHVPLPTLQALAAV